jgi:hypothetical protein
MTTSIYLSSIFYLLIFIKIICYSFRIIRKLNDFIMQYKKAKEIFSVLFMVIINIKLKNKLNLGWPMTSILSNDTKHYRTSQLTHEKYFKIQRNKRARQIFFIFFV